MESLDKEGYRVCSILLYVLILLNVSCSHSLCDLMLGLCNVFSSDDYVGDIFSQSALQSLQATNAGLFPVDGALVIG